MIKKVRIDISKHSNCLIYEAFQERITSDYSKLKWDLSSVRYYNKIYNTEYVYDLLIRYHNEYRIILPLYLYETENDLKSSAGIIKNVKKYKKFLTVDIELLKTPIGKKYESIDKIGFDIFFIKKPIVLECPAPFMRMTSDDQTVQFYSITINKTGINKIKIYENN